MSATAEVVPCGLKGPSPRGGSSTAAVGDVLYVLGGADREGNHYSDTFAFNLSTREWVGRVVTTGDVPPAFGGAAATVAGPSILLFGGMNAVEGVLFNTLHSLNTATMVWRKAVVAGDVPCGRGGASLTPPTVDGKCYLFGGSTPDDGPLNDFYQLQLPLEGEEVFVWTQLGTRGPAPLPREMHCAALLEVPSVASAPPPSASSPLPPTSATDGASPPKRFMALYGGRGFERVHSDICTLDLDTLVWASPVDTRHSRCSFADAMLTVPLAPATAAAAAPALCGSVCVFGGWDGASSFFDSLLQLNAVYDGASVSWTAKVFPVAPSVPDRFACAGGLDPLSRTLVTFGGMNAASDFNDVVFVALKG